jgi:hypothetical protein
MSKKTNIPTNPQAPKRGDRVKAKDIQHLAAQVKRLSRAGRENYSGAFYRAPDAPFTPKLRGKKDDPQAYEIALSKGYVIERRIPDGQALIYHFPTGLIDEEDKLIYHSISEGQAIYVQVQVEDDGKIESDPVVMVAEDELEGEHFRPEVFDFGGNAGTHNYKIAVFEIVDSKPRLKLFGAGDNVDHYDERVGMINMEAEGDVFEVGFDYDSSADKVRFRRLKNLDGEGVALIKDQVDESINFRKIRGRDSPRRIEVEESGGSIIVKGNNAMGTLSHIACNEEIGSLLIEWDDGLIITEGAVTFEAGCPNSSGGGGMA